MQGKKADGDKRAEDLNECKQSPILVNFSSEGSTWS